MLYRPEAFEPLTESPWDEQRVRAAIRRIVEDVDRAFDADALWPADDWDGWQAAVPMKNLYVGAAGVVWALDALRRRGLAETQIDLAAAARRTLTCFREAPDLMSGVELPAPAGVGTAHRRDRDPPRRLAPRPVRRTRARAARARADRTSTTKRTSSCGALPGHCSPPARCTSGRAATRGGTRAPRARRRSGVRADRTGSGRSDSTAKPRAASARPTAWSATCSRSWTRSTADGAKCSNVRRQPYSHSEAIVEDGLANWPMNGGGDLLAHGRRDPRAVVRGSARHRDLRGVVPRRGAAHGRRGAHLARGPSDHGEGPVHLPRHRRQRLRVPQGVRAHRRRALARSCATLRDARARTGRAPRPRPLLAVDGRPRRRAVRRRLPRRAQARTPCSRPGANGQSRARRSLAPARGPAPRRRSRGRAAPDASAAT